jgi:hypothetical protein
VGLKDRPPVFSLDQVRYLSILRHPCHLQSLIAMYAWTLRTKQKDASKKAGIHQHSH